ncbi:MAG: zinc-dependent metalloprotease [Bacteroidetes bacterium]|nr:zinc-dependent metalloprotease [Bacteroidota bacterium]
MRIYFVSLALLAVTVSFGQQRPQNPTPTPGSPTETTSRPTIGAAGIGGPNAPKPGPKAYKDVITDKAISSKGLFTVHKVDDKFYFEIADSIMGREIYAITRFAKVPGGAGVYGGGEVNKQTLKFEKGPSNNVFLRVVTLISMADSTNNISKAVSNSYLDPIGAAFDVKAYGKDSTSTVIDVTDFFKGDNQVVGLDQNDKRQFNLTAIAADRSYVQSIRTYPINTEIKTVKTYSTSAGSPMGFGGSPFPGASGFTAASRAGAVTMELNTSMLLLPKTPMTPRLFDRRVGYFADRYVLFSDDQQKVDRKEFAVRWKLEPKPEDREKYMRGELVEPMKQIVYYIDPATPKQWHKPLIDGINDWQKAFEKAGFKNAIVGKEWPTNDSTMSLEDARYSVIRYLASDIENASGPQVHDPRSGEILESHINWYHNVMKLVHDWYMIQTAAVDPKARKMKFDDELMGQLIRFVSSHEVGHTLGLRHNMGSSSRTPVEKLRDKAWVEANGHSASIMDYARFNYVAQPEDGISESGLFPRIGDYDKWAIEWGYKYRGIADAEQEEKSTNKWVIDNLSKNPRLWFGGEGRSADPRAQTEDLGDNSMKAGEYGIKNLKRIIVAIPEWTKEEANPYENLADIYSQLITQYGRYVGHVLRNVAGVQETFKTIEEVGDVYEPTPKAIQKEAIAFLNKQLFETPTWLLDKNILNKIANPISLESIQSYQTSAVNSLLDGQRLFRLVAAANRYGNTTYNITEMIADLHKGIFSELSSNKPIDGYRRNIQKVYVEKLIDIVDPTPTMTINLGGFGGPAPVNVKYTDVVSVAKGELKALQAEINAAANSSSDKISKYHLQDLADRIKKGLDPK